VTVVAPLDSPSRARLNIPPAGEWKGEIETIYSTQTVTTNFYKLCFGLNNKQSKIVVCLETESLGTMVVALGMMIPLAVQPVRKTQQMLLFPIYNI
jgi:hypothetical protein